MAYRYDPVKATTAANYPLIGNPHRHFYPTRNLPILMAVQHITAGSSDFDGVDTSAEGTVRYSATTATVASYHGIVDSDSIIDCLPDTYTAFAQGVRGHSFNSPALSLEIGLRSPDWRAAPKVWVDKTIRNAARWWAPRVKRYGIPLRVLTNRDEVDRLIAAGKPVGFVEHGTLDPGNRSDAGFISRGVTTFPWALLFTYIREELAVQIAAAPAPTEEDELSAAADDIKKDIKDYIGKILVAGYTDGGKPFPGMAKVDIETQRRVTALAAQVSALSAAVKALAESKGADSAAILKAVESATTKALSGLEITLTNK